MFCMCTSWAAYTQGRVWGSRRVRPWRILLFCLYDLRCVDQKEEGMMWKSNALTSSEFYGVMIQEYMYS